MTPEQLIERWRAEAAKEDSWDQRYAASAFRQCAGDLERTLRALAAPTPQPAPGGMVALDVALFNRVIAALEGICRQPVDYRIRVEADALALEATQKAHRFTQPQPAPDALREALGAWWALHNPDTMKPQSLGWWTGQQARAIELTRAALAEAGA